MTERRALLIRAGDEAWGELREVLSSFAPEYLTRPGYNESGWSAKDLIAHLGCWQAEASRSLVQIREGTYEGRAEDVESLNAGFYESWKDIEIDAVTAHLHASRARMLDEFNRLGQDLAQGDALEWFVESGAEHYRAHLPRLRAWLTELAAAR